MQNTVPTQATTSPNTGCIDLHLHSTASDGTQSPVEVVRSAAAAGMKVVALTDHDTTAGWDAAAAAAMDTGVGFIPGIEVSSKLGGASVHVLAYLPDPTHPALMASMERVRFDRVHRAQRIVAAIGEDYEFTWDDVVAVSQPGATIGRPHIADALVARGIIANRSDAFTGMLSHHSKYYVPHESPTPDEAIATIREAGGVPVLAHGGSRGQALLAPDVFARMVDAGLLGVEIEHRENDDESRRILRAYANDYDLIVTGSSDYHGTGKPNQIGENTTAPSQLARIVACGTGSAPVNLN